MAILFGFKSICKGNLKALTFMLLAVRVLNALSNAMLSKSGFSELSRPLKRSSYNRIFLVSLNILSALVVNLSNLKRITNG